MIGCLGYGKKSFALRKKKLFVILNPSEFPDMTRTSSGRNNDASIGVFSVIGLMIVEIGIN